MFNNKLKQQLSAQADELVELRQLVAGMTNEMLSLDIDTSLRIIACNELFATTLGYTEAQLVGRLMTELVPSYVTKLPCYNNFRSAVAAGTSVSDNYRYLKADGSLVWVNAHWKPIRNAAGCAHAHQVLCNRCHPEHGEGRGKRLVHRRLAAVHGGHRIRSERQRAVGQRSVHARHGL
ncbi:PAS domain S-box-containing protein [Pseudomonas sp. PvP001]